MPSLLDKVPYDILLNITYLSASGSICRPPHELLSLRLTCKTLHNHLSIQESAQLYARLFRSHFDASPLLLGSSVTMVNDFTLANEYLVRQEFLSRSRHSSWSTSLLTSDMWIAVRMLLESSGVNEKQLVAAKFPLELVKLAQAQLQEGEASTIPGSDSRESKYLLVWILSLTLSKTDITKVPVETRERICDLLHLYTIRKPITIHHEPPFITAFKFDLRSKARLAAAPHGGITASSSGSPSIYQQEHQRGLTLYSRQHEIPVESLNPYFAAINLIFAMKEACELQVPPHLPAARTTATTPLHRFSGPTVEDFRQFQSYRTPLFADARLWNRDASPAGRSGRNKSQDMSDLSHLYGVSVAHTPQAGTFTGLWQGSYMICSEESGSERYLNRRPLQVVFSEYHCFSPNIPLPPAKDANELSSLPTRPWEMDHPAQKHRYEKETGTIAIAEQRRSSTEVSQFSGAQNPRTIRDTILFGETTVDHDEAWSGFRYVGRIQEDGTVLLKREPKHQSEDYLGTWVFEGKLQFGKALVGSWRAHNSTDDQGAKGIFSMSKGCDDPRG